MASGTRRQLRTNDANWTKRNTKTISQGSCSPITGNCASPARSSTTRYSHHWWCDTTSDMLTGAVGRAVYVRRVNSTRASVPQSGLERIRYDHREHDHAAAAAHDVQRLSTAQTWRRSRLLHVQLLHGTKRRDCHVVADTRAYSELTANIHLTCPSLGPLSGDFADLICRHESSSRRVPATHTTILSQINWHEWHFYCQN